MTATPAATHRLDVLRPLAPTHPVYGVEVPWTCQVRGEHACDGVVVGAVGAYPTCAAGYPVEVAERVAERERVARLMDTPEMRRAVAWELRMEARHA